MKLWGLVPLLLLAACASEPETEAANATAQTAESAAPDAGETAMAETLEGLSAQDGFFTIFAAADQDIILARLPAPGADGVMLRAIYAQRLEAGLGSNPLGLDRGNGGSGVIIAFRKIGDKAVIEAENTTYRATTDNPKETEAVRQSFARSFLWSGAIESSGEDGVLVDITSFLKRDGANLADRLHEGEGRFSLDGERSFVDGATAKAFPDNVEISAYLTFASSDPGMEVNRTAIEPEAVTLIQHHSFVRLPDSGYAPRASDPRIGPVDIGYYDMGAPLAEPVLRRYAVRHRLTLNEAGEVENPIIYYVDPGAPEPVRTALVEGAQWWADAFDAAGFPGAYRVEILPEDADPLDVRYNVIQWVHRETRGWSYGGGVVDPRTGERLKGHVILGSQRVRQDRMIFEGLAGVAKTGTGADDDPVELALDRIRQLSAHEVGHAIGLGHNFAASAQNRASVMDYPHPWVRANADGTLDFSQTYDVGMGAWDIASLSWLYAIAPEGADEAAYLEGLVRGIQQEGLLFVADGGGRGTGTMHPYASVWDNGADPVAELENVMAVRRIALEGFGLDRISEGAPASDLRKVIVPIYLYHRYQTPAAAKLLGGRDYAYSVKGDGAGDVSIVAEQDQRRAMNAVLATLDPAALDLREAVIDRLVPANPSQAMTWRERETFEGRAAGAFDLMAAAEAAGDLSLGALLHPARAERLIQQKEIDRGQIGFGDLTSAIEDALFQSASGDRQEAIRVMLIERYAVHLMDLERSGGVSPALRESARAALQSLDDRLNRLRPRLQGLEARIAAHLARPAAPADPRTEAPDAPPGSPIGTSVFEECWSCDPL